MNRIHTIQYFFLFVKRFGEKNLRKNEKFWEKDSAVFSFPCVDSMFFSPRKESRFPTCPPPVRGLRKVPCGICLNLLPFPSLFVAKITSFSCFRVRKSEVKKCLALMMKMLSSHPSYACLMFLLYHIKMRLSRPKLKIFLCRFVVIRDLYYKDIFLKRCEREKQ